MPTHRLNAEEAADRKARIVELRRARRPWDTIGSEFGISGVRAYQLYQQAIQERPNLQVDEHRAEETELIDLAVRRLMAIAVNPQVSPRTQVEAWSSLRGWSEHKTRMLGLNAAVLSRVEVITEDVVDAEIRRLEAEVGARVQAAAADRRSRGEDPASR